VWLLGTRGRPPHPVLCADPRVKPEGRPSPPEGEVQGYRGRDDMWAVGASPLTRLGLRPIHPLPEGARNRRRASSGCPPPRGSRLR
jgi:hypothetical protein